MSGNEHNTHVTENDDNGNNNNNNDYGRRTIHDSISSLGCDPNEPKTGRKHEPVMCMHKGV